MAEEEEEEELLQTLQCPTSWNTKFGMEVPRKLNSSSGGEITFGSSASFVITKRHARDGGGGDTLLFLTRRGVVATGFKVCEANVDALLLLHQLLTRNEQDHARRVIHRVFEEGHLLYTLAHGDGAGHFNLSLLAQYDFASGMCIFPVFGPECKRPKNSLFGLYMVRGVDAHDALVHMRNAHPPRAWIHAFPQGSSSSMIVVRSWNNNNNNIATTARIFSSSVQRVANADAEKRLSSDLLRDTTNPRFATFARMCVKNFDSLLIKDNGTSLWSFADETVIVGVYNDDNNDTTCTALSNRRMVILALTPTTTTTDEEEEDEDGVVLVSGGGGGGDK